MPPELLPIEKAIKCILALSRPGGSEPVALEHAIGRVLALDVYSDSDVPSFDSSAMDGYAIRSVDIAGADRNHPILLARIDESRAGLPAEHSIAEGGAIAISTGAVVPEGADAVVRVEETSQANSSVAVHASVEPGGNIRRAGDDIRRGEKVLANGTMIAAAEVGVLASAGRAGVPVYAEPRVAILTTGDELIGPEDPLRPGAVRNSNEQTLRALAESSAGTVVLNRSVPDSLEATGKAIEKAIGQSDLVLISGGVSVGEHDHVKDALGRMGVREEFWRIALKPGRPTWFGQARNGTLVFGLPGNPVSSMVTFLLLVRPALAHMSGLSGFVEKTEAVLNAPAHGQAGRVHAVRCQLSLESGRVTVTPTGEDQSSHILTSMLGADCLALLPPGKRIWQAGERVEIVRFAEGLRSS